MREDDMRQWIPALAAAVVVDDVAAAGAAGATGVEAAEAAVVEADHLRGHLLG